jgi:hypothetical protein
MGTYLKTELNNLILILIYYLSEGRHRKDLCMALMGWARKEDNFDLI